jgi:GxxExxY protein
MTESSYVDTRYLHSELTARIIAAATEVYHQLGPGFREVIYQRALTRELNARGLEHTREVSMDMHYRGDKIGRIRVDFVIGDGTADIMLEIKAKNALEDVDKIQALSYLRASGFRVGLLINFGGRHLEIKRFIN